MEEMKAKIVETDRGRADGRTQCPKCGSSDISMDATSGKLRCNFCRHEFEAEKFDDMEADVNKLRGEIIASGAAKIQKDAESIITLVCPGCGAEVVIDTIDQLQARCHWCRSTLSINKQVPNGAVPDTILPFKLGREEARETIETYVGKHKFFAKPQFKKEFTTENIMGVYLPYMIVDANAHAHFSGQGEVEVRRYQVKNGEDTETYYDADLYNVDRDFDLTIKGLTVESSQDKLDVDNNEKTNNIINAIMPFDTENCVNWDVNYLKGFTSEKRDVDVEQLKPIVEQQCTDIARYRANDTIKKYDRGVRWDKTDMNLKGRQWTSAYLPVWLYSYMEEKKDKKMLHYVAVNARTKETIGSVPIHKPKLLITSILVELVSVIAALLLFIFAFDSEDWYPWVLAAGGVVFYFAIYSSYRHAGARHEYEEETESKIANVRKSDEFVKHRKHLSNSTMDGANNY